MSPDLARHGPQAIALQSLDDIERFAIKIAQSLFVPAPFRGKPADIIAAVMYGLERGLSPLTSLQNIAVINGKPSVYGDMLKAICMNDPSTESFREAETEEIDRTGLAWCEAKRVGQSLVRRTFSRQDAEKAKLWTKEGPWTQYPSRMLMMRARSWCLRDAYADRLMGLQAREEAQDIIDVPHTVVVQESPATEPLTIAVSAAYVAAHPQPVTGTMARSLTSQAAPAPIEPPASGGASSAPGSRPEPPSAPERQNIGHIGRFDKPALLAAILVELQRLCGEDKEAKASFCREVWGGHVMGYKDVEQLQPGSLRTGLKKLHAKPTPAQPPMIMVSQTDVTEEERPLIPLDQADVPRHSGPELPQDQRSDPDLSQGASNGAVVTTGEPEGITPPDRPVMVGEFIPVDDARILRMFAEMHGELGLFNELTKGCLYDADGELQIPLGIWERIVRGVTYLVQSRTQEEASTHAAEPR